MSSVSTWRRGLFACLISAAGVAAYSDPTRVSSAVVLVTIQERAAVLQPELQPTSPVVTNPDGTSIVPLPSDQVQIGALYRVRVDEVLKRDGVLVIGSVVDVYDPLQGSSAQTWSPVVGEQYVLYLNLPLRSEAERRAVDPVVRRRRLAPNPSATDEIVDLDGAFRVVDGEFGGAARASTLRLSTVRAAVLAAATPTVVVSTPNSGSTVSGQVTLSADAHDDGGIVGVQFRIDGANVGAEDVTRPFAYLWRSKDVANGAHSVTAVTRDGSGYTSISAPVSFTTANTNVAPQVTATPTGHTGAAKTFTWSWSDADGDVLTCQFEVLQPTQCTYMGNCLNVGGSANGSTTCQAKVMNGQPGGTACDYRLTCSDGWASAAAIFHLFYPN